MATHSPVPLGWSKRPLIKSEDTPVIHEVLWLLSGLKPLLLSSRGDDEDSAVALNPLILFLWFSTVMAHRPVSTIWAEVRRREKQFRLVGPSLLKYWIASIVRPLLEKLCTQASLILRAQTFQYSRKTHRAHPRISGPGTAPHNRNPCNYVGESPHGHLQSQLEGGPAEQRDQVWHL